MPLIHLKGSLLLDLNLLYSSEKVPSIGPQCLQFRKRFQLDLLLTWRHWPPIMRGLLLTYSVLASNYAGSFVDLEALVSRGGVWGRSPQEGVTAATAAAAVSQELSPFGRALGASRPGTKHPVRGIPHFDIQ